MSQSSGNAFYISGSVAMCVCCACNVCKLCVRCACSVRELCVHCACSVCVMCVLCVCDVCVMCVRCAARFIHNLYKKLVFQKAGLRLELNRFVEQRTKKGLFIAELI